MAWATDDRRLYWQQRELDDRQQDAAMLATRPTGNPYIDLDVGSITVPIGYVRKMVAALAWYGEQTRLARLVHSGGDAGRHALQDDGGKIAAASLELGQSFITAFDQEAERG